MRGSLVVAALLATTVLGACHNACQDVCVRMKEYAEEDCGIQVPDADLDACFESQTGLDPEDAQACRDYGDPAAIRDQWDCAELETYWSPAAG